RLDRLVPAKVCGDGDVLEDDPAFGYRGHGAPPGWEACDRSTCPIGRFVKRVRGARWPGARRSGARVAGPQPLVRLAERARPVPEVDAVRPQRGVDAPAVPAADDHGRADRHGQAGEPVLRGLD